MSRADVWMTVEMVRDELHFSTAAAARKWIYRRKLARIKRGGPDGRGILVARTDVERSFFQRRAVKEDSASGLAGAHRAEESQPASVPAADCHVLAGSLSDKGVY